jgi:MFS family permease
VSSTSRGFRRLWVSAGASNLADGILFAGLPVLATQVTDSPALIAGVAVALMLPMALLALPAGVIADRFDRRQVLVLGNVVRVGGIAAVLAAALAGELGLAAIYAVAAITGGSEILVDTTAQTAVPALVDTDGLETANARLGGTQVVMNDAIGAPVGSFLAGMGAGLAFGVPVLLFAVAAVLLRRLPLRRPVAVDRTGPLLADLRDDVRRGARYLADHDVLRRLAIVNGFSNLGNTAFGAVFVVFVVGPLGLPARTYGWFLAALAVGGVAGSLVATRVLRTLGHASTVKVAAALSIAVYATVSTTSNPWVMAGCATVLGAVSMVWNVGTRVLRQTLVPDALLGRVTATMALVALIATPIGGVLGGLVAEVAGVRAAGGVAVAANVVAFLWLLPVTTAAVEAARRRPEPAPATIG